jgi:subtilisin family serine protease
MEDNFFIRMALWGLICGAAASAFGKTRSEYKVRVAVIDTGIDPQSTVPQCPNSSEDFTGKGLQDRIGHGSHVADTIDQYVKGRVRNPSSYKFDLGQYNSKYDYCQIILKFYHETYEGTDLAEKEKHDAATEWNTVLAFRKAIMLGANVINYSAGGASFDRNEKLIVEQALDAGIIIVAAAGNNNECLDNDHDFFYPASYDKRIITVGNRLNKKPITDYAAWSHRGKCTVPAGMYRHPTSNFGPWVNLWEFGTDLIGKAINGEYITLTGTSQSTAVTTGKIVRKILEQK